MRFDQLAIGTKFVHSITGSPRAYVFKKKSLSSAYVLDPITLEPVTLSVSFHRLDKTGSICGFGVAVEVHPLA